jgi:hypothetical protein
MSYNSSHRPHPFEVVEKSKYHDGDSIVKCPVCGLHRWNNAMRIHIAHQAREDKIKGGGEHLDWYNAHTHEITVTKRVWNV